MSRDYEIITENLLPEAIAEQEFRSTKFAPRGKIFRDKRPILDCNKQPRGKTTMPEYILKRMQLVLIGGYTPQEAIAAIRQPKPFIPIKEPEELEILG